MAESSGTWMTVAELCDELGVARSTFDDWRAKGRAPKCVRLPDGSPRIRRVDFESWRLLLLLLWPMAFPRPSAAGTRPCRVGAMRDHGGAAN